jgi:hypothetical protein
MTYEVRFTLKERDKISLKMIDKSPIFDEEHRLNRDENSLALLEFINFKAGKAVKGEFHTKDGDNPAFITVNGDLMDLDHDLPVDLDFVDQEKEMDFLGSPFEVGKYYASKDQTACGRLVKFAFKDNEIRFVLKVIAFPMPIDKSVDAIIQLKPEYLEALGESRNNYYEEI